MSDRSPNLRPLSQGNDSTPRDGLALRFIMHRSHQAFAPDVVRMLDAFVRAIRPATLSWYPDMEGYWQSMDDKAWERIRKELLEYERPYVTLTDSPDDDLKVLFEYTGTSLEETRLLDWPGRACLARLWLPTEFLEQQGPRRVRELALELASFLPFQSGYASLSFNVPYATVEMIEHARKMCFRYPGMDVLDDSIAFDIGTRVPGAYWLTFLGQPVLGELGGVDGLRARLSSPGTTVQQLEEDRAVVTLGQWPDPGDLETGRDLPAYRELARVLEPWLYHDSGRLRHHGFPTGARLRWERRFLD